MHRDSISYTNKPSNTISLMRIAAFGHLIREEINIATDNQGLVFLLLANKRLVISS